MKGTCAIEACDRQVVAKGYCNTHYHRFKYAKDKSLTPINVIEKRTHCTVEGCTGKHIGHGFCYAHYERFKKHADPLSHIPVKKKAITKVTCHVEGCGRKTKANGNCDAHHKRWLQTGNVQAHIPLRDFTTKECRVAGCYEEKKALGLCEKHYQKFKLYKDPTCGVERKKANLGSQTVDKTGYVLVYVKGIKNRGKWVREHRYVMEQVIGRLLTTREFVHHRNGDREDNRSENLELWSKSHPSGQRVSDLISWAKTILSQYGDDEAKF
ncbi:HNH endonuclease [Spirosoma arcticum]